MKQFHPACIEQGKLLVKDKSKFKSLVKNLPDGDYVMLLLSQNDKSTRDCQNRYFAILGEWSLDVGETKSHLHEMVKNELFFDLFGEVASTTDLSADEWTVVFWNLENWLILKYENR